VVGAAVVNPGVVVVVVPPGLVVVVVRLVVVQPANIDAASVNASAQATNFLFIILLLYIDKNFYDTLKLFPAGLCKYP
jgi:hypothetical protein